MHSNFHYFNPAIAAKTDITAAAVFNLLQLFIESNKTQRSKPFYQEGKYWTCISMEGIGERIPYLTLSQIRTALKKLLECGLLEKANFNRNAHDRTSWYSYNPEILEQIVTEYNERLDSIKPDYTPIDCIKEEEEEENIEVETPAKQEKEAKKAEIERNYRQTAEAVIDKMNTLKSNSTKKVESNILKISKAIKRLYKPDELKQAFVEISFALAAKAACFKKAMPIVENATMAAAMRELRLKKDIDNAKNTFDFEPYFRVDTLFSGKLDGYIAEGLELKAIFEKKGKTNHNKPQFRI